MIMIFDDCSGNPRPRVTWSKVNQADIVGEGEALELREVGRRQCHLPHHHDDEPDDDPDHAHEIIMIAGVPAPRGDLPVQRWQWCWRKGG